MQMLELAQERAALLAEPLCEQVVAESQTDQLVLARPAYCVDGRSFVGSSVSRSFEGPILGVRFRVVCVVLSRVAVSITDGLRSLHQKRNEIRSSTINKHAQTEQVSRSHAPDRRRRFVSARRRLAAAIAFFFLREKKRTAKSTIQRKVRSVMNMISKDELRIKQRRARERLRRRRRRRAAARPR
jgi:hypothetical protein